MMSERFTPEQLRVALSRLPETTRYWVAYSGGLDSHVLLHAMAALREHLQPVGLGVVHVNHGLHGDALAWAGHCARICGDLDVPLTQLEVDARPVRGESPEAAARRARYEAVGAVMGAGDVVLTAHHRDDQAETLVLHLLRGSGPHGLAAMPPCRSFQQGWLARPLLDLSRQALREYAEARSLSWVDDPSNHEDRFERNFLRNEIMPALKIRWPALTDVLARAAAHQSEAARLVDTLADTDLDGVRGGIPGTLRLDLLLTLSPERQRNLLRRWFGRMGLPLPTTAHLDRVVQDVMGADVDRTPLVRWEGAEVRRYRDRLFAMPPLAPATPDATLCWPLEETLLLPDGRLSAERVAGQGIKVPAGTPGVAEVRFRHGGERCRPAGRLHSHSLKKLLQERGVPPWVRQRLPLVYVAGELAAVADLWVCEPLAAREGETGWRISWHGRLADTSKAVG